MTNSHQERVMVLHEILRVCHENGWNYDTAGLADRIELVATRMGFSRSTVKGLVYSTIELLRMEKDYSQALASATSRSQEAPAI